MAKQIEKSDVLKRLEKAQSIRQEADKQAKEIESSVLQELKDEKKALLEQVAQIDNEIGRIIGVTVSASASSGKGKRARLENTILEIVKEAGKISCADIESNLKMTALYAPDAVPSQATKLKSMVKEKKLKKDGERKKAVYSLA